MEAAWWALWWGAAALLGAWVMWARGAEGRRRIRRCGESIPGPRTLPILGNILELGFEPKKVLEVGLKLHHKYGNIFRAWLGPSHLLVNLLEPCDIEVLLSNNTNIKKAFNYDFFKSWLGLGLLTSTGERWRQRRKIITPTFHFSILEQFVEIFNKQGTVLLSILKKKEGGAPFDITPLIDLYTQDVICESAMGVELNAQTEGYANAYVRSVKNMCEILSERTLSPWLYPQFLFNLSSLGRQEKILLEILHGLTNEVINRKKQQSAENPEIYEDNIDDIGRKKKFAFLDLLLHSSRNGNVLTDEDIREEVDTFMFEGHDTTASGISFALYELSKRPDIQEKVLDELKEVASNNNSEDFSPNMEDLNKLKYLEQVIKETLRLYPSVPIFGRQITEDLPLVSLPGPVVIPPGVTVAVSPVILHRRSDLYPDPLVFNPDNFSLEAVSKRHPYAYLPFSAGSRNCIGQRFAMLEMKSILAKIIWNYSLQIDPTFEMKLRPEITLKPMYGVRLSIIPRIHA